jgi:hypothetical protein
VRVGKRQARFVRKVSRARAATATIRLDGQTGRATRSVRVAP